MVRTPGFIIPSAYSSKEELEKDLRRRDAASGFTSFKLSDFVDVDDSLAHHGKKGMKWGVRHPRSDEAERKARFSPKAKKIALGVGIAAGAAAAAYLISQKGNVPVSTFTRANFKPTPSQKLDALRVRQGEVFANKLKGGVMNQTLHFDTKKNAWGMDQAVSTSKDLVRRASSSQGNRNSSRNLNLGNLADIRAAINDPNFVWEL